MEPPGNISYPDRVNIQLSQFEKTDEKIDLELLKRPGSLSKFDISHLMDNERYRSYSLLFECRVIRGRIGRQWDIDVEREGQNVASFMMHFLYLFCKGASNAHLPLRPDETLASCG